MTVIFRHRKTIWVGGEQIAVTVEADRECKLKIHVNTIPAGTVTCQANIRQLLCEVPDLRNANVYVDEKRP